MTGELREHTGELKQALSKPIEYKKKLEEFQSEDEKVLSTFLMEDRLEKTFIEKYNRYKLLWDDPDRYKKPLELLEKNIISAHQTLELKKTINRDDFFDFPVSENFIEFFDSIDEMFTFLLKVESAFCEYVVACAKEIAQERGMDPLDIVKTQEGRDEVRRRIFPTKELFDYYNQVMAYQAQASFTFTHIMANRLREKTHTLLEPDRKAVEEHLDKIPPRDIIEEYIKDVKEYNLELSCRIYGEKTPVLE